MFFQKKTFLIFLEMEPCTFRPKLEEIKNPPRKKFLTYFRKTETLKKLLMFWEMELFSPPQKFFLYFRKRKPQIISCISQKKVFLIFQKMETSKKFVISAYLDFDDGCFSNFRSSDNVLKIAMFLLKGGIGCHLSTEVQLSICSFLWSW